MKYVIQMYRRYPIYEPAEGGYYYEGMAPDTYSQKYNTKQEAMGGLREFVEEENANMSAKEEGYLILSSEGLEAYTINHKYIGEGFEYRVEPLNQRGHRAKGPVPYC